MNIETLKETLESGTEREISDLSYSILNISDSSILIEIARNLNELTPFATSSLWDKSEDKLKIQESIDRIVRFLELVSISGCCCSKYSICSYFPFAEEKRGLVEILENETHNETWESYVECKCTSCGQKYSVFEREAGFGRRAEWQEKN